ncbi:MAG: DNA repair protein RadA [Acidobacteria bacterium]|nr:DNA repair protein RadA [Acidobacteriota bacterium]
MGRNKEPDYICIECDTPYYKWIGRCTSCGAWDSIKENKKSSQKKSAAIAGLNYAPIPYSELPRTNEERIETGIDEFDRVLGGGLVKGSIILLGGEPGVGKSTILLQVSAKLANSGVKVLYISGEESPAQVKLRGERLGIDEKSGLLFLGETSLEIILALVESEKPDLLIIDSIQTVRSERSGTGAGSATLIREATSAFLESAKRDGITYILTGHVTKEGIIAGPKAIEHMVDTVLYFEGEKKYDHRIIRTTKNRFGAVNELGIFEMRKEGLIQADDISRYFISTADQISPGAAVFPAHEGTRSLLVEIQALVSLSNYSTPRRTVVGMDYNRAILVLAVLDKQLGLNLSDREVYLNVAGGVSIYEPAVDLALTGAVLSSYRNQPVAESTALLGELSLTGEVRGVNGIEDRLKELAHYKFKKVIIPDSVSVNNDYGLTLIRIRHINTLLEKLF